MQSDTISRKLEKKDTCMQNNMISKICFPFFIKFQGSSETIRDKSSRTTNKIQTSFQKSFHSHQKTSIQKNQQNIYEWVTGLIEADGGFYVSKKGYASCEITMATKEVQSLHTVKKFCGGSVSSRTSANAVRWRLHSKKSLLILLPLLANNFHIEKSFLQFQIALKAVDKEVEETKAPTVTSLTSLLNTRVCRGSAWFSGFFCGDGCFYINPRNFQITISVSQKTRPILDSIQEAFGGNVFKDKSWNGYVWQVSKREDLQEILNYFKLFPLRNPQKEAQLQSVLRFLRYKDRGDHLDSKNYVRLRHFVKLMND